MRALLVGLMLVASSGAGAVAAEDGRLRRAELLAQKNEAQAAVDIYRALLSEGRDGKDLRYNLGSLCLQLADLGCAVLHLRVAARMDPRDDDVRHNLDVALEARSDRLAGSPVVDPLRVIGEQVPARLARLALAIPLAVLGLALLLLALAGPRQRLRSLARALGVVGACSAVGGASVYACRLLVERSAEAVVVVPQTPALKEPDAAAAVAFTAHAGLFGDVVGSVPGMLRLRFENGLEAWIKESDTALVR